MFDVWHQTARRNFYEAREQAPQRCGWILRQIGHLYRIEEDLRGGAAGPRKCAAVRMSQSRPICQRLHRALVLFKKSRRYLPRRAFGQAIDYALSNWPLLGVYLEDGRIQIDNNLVENCIRPTALGKKNWLFLGDADAGQRSAILYHHYRELPLPRHRSLRLPARRGARRGQDLKAEEWRQASAQSYNTHLCPAMTLDGCREIATSRGWRLQARLATKAVERLIAPRE